MYISDTAITKPVLTVVAMLMFVVFGIVALTQLDTDEYPEIDAPVVVVAVPYPGASPDIVEREVVDPIEEAISGISGIDRMRSSSLDSYANIVVEFDFSKDPKIATQEIRDKISSIRSDLPTEMKEPILTQFDPADRPIVSLTLSSPGLSGPELTRMADPDITRRLRGITGVAAVNLVGAIERELVNPLSNLIASGQVRGGDLVSVDFDAAKNALAFFKEAENVPEHAVFKLWDLAGSDGGQRHSIATGTDLMQTAVPFLELEHRALSAAERT